MWNSYERKTQLVKEILDGASLMPRLALVAYAARCARRVQPFFRLGWRDSSPHDLEIVEEAIRVSEEAGGGRTRIPHVDIAGVVERADQSALAANDGIAHGADWGTEDMAHFGAVRAVASAQHALQAAAELSIEGTRTEAGRAIEAACGANPTDPYDFTPSDEGRYGPMVEPLRLDIGRLLEIASQNRWTDDTPVHTWFFDGPPYNAEAVVIQAISELSNQLVGLVAADPAFLDHVEWRDLERMLSLVFTGLGFDVDLTPPSKDGGKDLVLRCQVSGASKSYVVEIKHWRSGKKVTKGYISQFVNVIAREQRDGGMYVATSGYSADAIEVMSEIGHERLFLHGREKVVSLCRTYVRVAGGVWHPPDPLSGILIAS
jgi:hypothetical protein